MKLAATALLCVMGLTLAGCQATFAPKPGQSVRDFQADDYERERDNAVSPARRGVGLYNKCMESKGYQRK